MAGCGLTTTAQRGPAIPSQPSGVRAAPRWVLDRMANVAPDLYFQLNSHVLSRPEQRKLKQIAIGLQDILHDFPDLIIVIEGHCDDRGLAQYNEELGLQRAEEIRRLLLSLSFPDDHLRTVSISHRAPLCLSPDDGCRQKNRRVHFRGGQPMWPAGREK